MARVDINVPYNEKDEAKNSAPAGMPVEKPGISPMACPPIILHDGCHSEMYCRLTGSLLRLQDGAGNVVRKL